MPPPTVVRLTTESLTEEAVRPFGQIVAERSDCTNAYLADRSGRATVRRIPGLGGVVVPQAQARARSGRDGRL